MRSLEGVDEVEGGIFRILSITVTTGQGRALTSATPWFTEPRCSTVCVPILEFLEKSGFLKYKPIAFTGFKPESNGILATSLMKVKLLKNIHTFIFLERGRGREREKNSCLSNVL